MTSSSNNAILAISLPRRPPLPSPLAQAAAPQPPPHGTPSFSIRHRPLASLPPLASPRAHPRVPVALHKVPPGQLLRLSPSISHKASFLPKVRRGISPPLCPLCFAPLPDRRCARSHRSEIDRFPRVGFCPTCSPSSILVLADCLFARVSLALVPPDTTAANSIYRMSNVDVATLPL